MPDPAQQTGRRADMLQSRRPGVTMMASRRYAPPSSTMDSTMPTTCPATGHSPRSRPQWQRLALALAATLLSACGRGPAPGPEIHDTKYRAVSQDGAVLDPSVAPGSCVFDQFTGLTWEAKSDQPGLHDWQNTYSWWDPQEDHSGELDYRGEADGGSCRGSACDTAAFVAAVNAAGLCGHNDWRMPTRDELGSISDPRKTASPPTINTRFFPLTQAGEYWSVNDYQFQWNAAWVWSFQTGLDRVEWKRSPRYVRLVRGSPQHIVRVKD
jgi:hypothetical protein